MAEGIITRRGSIGIKPYVTKITFTNDLSSYYDTEYGAQVAYYENGDIFVSIKRKNNAGSSYKTCVFNFTSAPEGATMKYDTIHTPSSSTTGSDRIYGVVLSGITSTVSIDVAIQKAGSSSANVNLTITEVS